MKKFQIRSWCGKEFFITKKNSHKTFFSVEAWDLYLFIRDENLADRFVKWYIRKKEEELHKLKENINSLKEGGGENESFGKKCWNG